MSKETESVRVESATHKKVAVRCKKTRQSIGGFYTLAAQKELVNGKQLNSAESVMAFLAWITTRKEKVTFSSSDNAAIAVELFNQFAKANKLPPIRDNYTDYITPIK
jgi:hypothetical protein